MIPDSVWAEAKRRDVSAVDFWLSLTETVRDTLHQRALNEGATRVGITQAIDEVEARYPFVAEKERYTTAFSALTYGCGIGIWDIAFYRVNEDDELGEKLPMDEVRNMLERMSDGNPEGVGRDVAVCFDLTPEDRSQ